MDATALKTEIANLHDVKQMRRYPPALRRRLRAFAKAHPDWTLTKMCDVLDVSPATLRGFLNEEPQLTPVVVKEPPSELRIRLGSVVIEGASVGDVVAILRGLSC